MTQGLSMQPGAQAPRPDGPGGAVGGAVVDAAVGPGPGVQQLPALCWAIHSVFLSSTPRHTRRVN